MRARLRHGVLLGAFSSALVLAVEIFGSWPHAEEAALALRWLPAYCAAGATLGALAALLAPWFAGPLARERGPGVLLFGTLLAFAILGGTWLPSLLRNGALPSLAWGILGTGSAVGVHLLGVAAASARSAWLAGPLLAPFTAAAGLLAIAALTGLAVLILPADRNGKNPPPHAAGAGRPFNVAIVILDGARARNFGAYGSFRAASPRFDTLAEQGVLFNNAFTTTPDHAEAIADLLGGERSLAAECTALGWQTWACSADPAFSSASDEPASAAWTGFSRVEDLLVPPLPARLALARLVDGLRSRVQPPAHHRPADLVVQRALALIAGRDPERPFLAVVHGTDLLPPHDPPPELRDRFLPEGLAAADLEPERLPQDPLRLALAERGEIHIGEREAEALHSLYDAELLALDQALGAFADGLLDLGVLEDTLLVVTADHGLLLGDDGGRLGHANSVHDSVLRVPLLLRLPQRLPAGASVAALVSLEDLAPAIRALRDGGEESLLLHAARGETPRTCVVARVREKGAEIRVLRTGYEKILVDGRNFVVTAGDLRADPDENFLRARNLEDAAVERWWRRAAELLRSTSAAGGSGNGGTIPGD
jgi:hypothetical protein